MVLGAAEAHLGKGNHGAIVEDGEEHNKDGGEVEVVQHREQAKGEADPEGHGHRVPASRHKPSALCQREPGPCESAADPILNSNKVR